MLEPSELALHEQTVEALRERLARRDYARNGARPERSTWKRPSQKPRPLPAPLVPADASGGRGRLRLPERVLGDEPLRRLVRLVVDDLLRR